MAVLEQEKPKIFVINANKIIRDALHGELVLEEVREFESKAGRKLYACIVRDSEGKLRRLTVCPQVGDAFPLKAHKQKVMVNGRPWAGRVETFTFTSQSGKESSIDHVSAWCRGLSEV